MRSRVAKRKKPPKRRGIVAAISRSAVVIGPSKNRIAACKCARHRSEPISAEITPHYRRRGQGASFRQKREVGATTPPLNIWLGLTNKVRTYFNVAEDISLKLVCAWDVGVPLVYCNNARR